MDNENNIIISRYAFERMQTKDEKNDRWRNIIILVLIILLVVTNKRLIDGYTFQRISDHLHDEHQIELSVRQLKNIIPRLEEKLFRHI